MYNDLSKLKLNLMLVRKASIRVAFFLSLVYLVVNFAHLQGWFFEELSNVSLFGSALLLFLCVTMAFLEDEVQKILNKSPFSFGAGHYQPFGFGNNMSSEEYKDAMQEYNSENGSDRSDDLFAPVGDEFSSNFFKEEIKETKMSGNWDEIVAKIKNLPTRTLKDLSQRSDALKEYDDNNFDLLRNEFLANVFGLPEGSLPEGEDVNTYEKDAHFSGSYSSDVLFTLPMGSWLHYQNCLVSLFGSMYEIKFYDDNNEESSRGLHIAYRLK